MIDRAYVDLYRDDRRFLEIPVHSVGAIQRALSVDDFNQAQIRRKKHALHAERLT